MFEMFFPDTYVDSAYGLDYEKLYSQGYRGIIFDIDNTLVPHGAPADGRAITFFKRLRAIGFGTCLISNNKEPRVKPFADDVGSLYIYKAGKPNAKNYLRAMELMKTELRTTFFVGDQLFTDILGAKRAGMYNILVKPMDPREEIQIVLKRYLERIVLHFYAKEQREKISDEEKIEHD